MRFVKQQRPGTRTAMSPHVGAADTAAPAASQMQQQLRGMTYAEGQAALAPASPGQAMVGGLSGDSLAGLKSNAQAGYGSEAPSTAGGAKGGASRPTDMCGTQTYVSGDFSMTLIVEGDRAILSFAGTESVADAVSDTSLMGVGFDQFSENAAEIKQWLEAASAQTGQKVKVVGHSLGGAHAMTAAAYFPEYVGEVETVDAPGVSGDTVQRVEDWNKAHPQEAISSTHLIAAGSVVHKAGDAHTPGQAFVYDSGYRGFNPGEVHSLDRAPTDDQSAVTPISVDALHDDAYASDVELWRKVIGTGVDIVGSGGVVADWAATNKMLSEAEPDASAWSRWTRSTYQVAKSRLAIAGDLGTTIFRMGKEALAPENIKQFGRDLLTLGGMTVDWVGEKATALKETVAAGVRHTIDAAKGAARGAWEKGSALVGAATRRVQSAVQSVAASGGKQLGGAVGFVKAQGSKLIDGVTRTVSAGVTKARQAADAVARTASATWERSKEVAGASVRAAGDFAKDVGQGIAKLWSRATGGEDREAAQSATAGDTASRGQGTAAERVLEDARVEAHATAQGLRKQAWSLQGALGGVADRIRGAGAAVAQRAEAGAEDQSVRVERATESHASHAQAVAEQAGAAPAPAAPKRAAGRDTQTTAPPGPAPAAAPQQPVKRKPAAEPASTTSRATMAVKGAAGSVMRSIGKLFG